MTIITDTCGPRKWGKEPQTPQHLDHTFLFAKRSKVQGDSLTLTEQRDTDV